MKNGILRIHKWKILFGVIILGLLVLVITSYGLKPPSNHPDKEIFLSPEEAFSYGISDLMQDTGGNEKPEASAVIWQTPLKEREGELYLINRTFQNEKSEQRYSVCFCAAAADKNGKYHWEKVTPDFALGGAALSGTEVPYFSWSAEIDQYTIVFGRLISPYKRLLYDGNDVKLDEGNFFCFTIPGAIPGAAKAEISMEALLE